MDAARTTLLCFVQGPQARFLLFLQLEMIDRAIGDEAVRVDSKNIFFSWLQVFIDQVEASFRW